MAKEARLVIGYPWQVDEDKDERYTNEYGQQNEIEHIPDPPLLRNPLPQKPIPILEKRFR
jgi:hypothetical protein